MKAFLLYLSLALAVTACGGPDDKASATAPGATASNEASSNWVPADLSRTKLKLPLVVQAPKGYTLNDSLSQEIEVNTENISFSVSALGEAEAVSQTKGYRDEAAHADGFKKFVLDTPEGFIVEGNGGFMPYRVVKVGGKGYEFRVIPLYALSDEEAAKELYEKMGQAKAL